LKEVFQFTDYGNILSLASLHQLFPAGIYETRNKSRNGSKVYKVYDIVQTPYQRVSKSDVLTDTKKAELTATYSRLNQMQLLMQISQSLEHFWALKERRTTSSHRINQQ